MSPWVRIVIVDYRSGAHLEACVDALLKQTYENFEVIIVDNDCPEGAARKLDLSDARFTLLSAATNTGYAGGSNLGARHAKTPWLIMLNPDTVPLSNWLSTLQKATDKYPDTVMFGTTLLKADEPETLDGFGDVLSIFGATWRGGTNQPLSEAPNHDLEVFGPCGAGAMYRRDVFDAMGGFEESFFCYVEDVDLAWRIGLHGGRCIQVHDALAHHVGGASTLEQPEFSLYHSARNAVWMIAGTAPALMIVPMLALNVFVRIYLSVRGSYGKNRGAVLRGLRDGWRGIGPHLFYRRRQTPNNPRLGPTPPNARPTWSVNALRNTKIVGTRPPSTQ
jgi:GT2 family glycosyltransferase